MNVVIAIDSFKGSLSSLQAGEAVKEGILRVNNLTRVHISPLADGGEGTVSALCEAMGGEMIELEVTGPLFERVKAKYAIINGNLAVIEMAEASGLTLVKENRRNPMKTTTYGVGEIIKDALSRGVRRFIVGIGGSATNDGGVGMLSALGFSFKDKDGAEITPTAEGLSNLRFIDTCRAIPALSETTFRVACDVKNPLCGEQGASRIYGPQKGASPDDVVKMDSWLKRYSDIARTVSDKANPDTEGAGAAGGLGFAFLTFLNSALEPGIKTVIEETMLEEHIKNADIVVTGEGRLDAQSAMGKAPIGVARLAKKHGKRTIAFSGAVSDDAGGLNSLGIDAFFPILRKIVTLDEALLIDVAYKNLADTAEQVFRLIL